MIGQVVPQGSYWKVWVNGLVKGKCFETETAACEYLLETVCKIADGIIVACEAEGPRIEITKGG